MYRDFLKSIPKAELHCHLDGSLRLSTLIELVDAGLSRGKQLPTTQKDPEKAVAALGLGQAYGNLNAYLKTFDFINTYLQDEAALRRVTNELIADASAENIAYLEIRFCPLLHTREALDARAVLKNVCEAVQEANQNGYCDAALLVTALRQQSGEESMFLARLAAEYMEQGVVGFDFAGQEADYSLKEHQGTISFLNKEQIPCTIHAGEAAGSASVREALAAGAQRLGHGIALRDDDVLRGQVFEGRIVIEVCPTSNVQTGAVPSYEDHPVKAFLEEGLLVSVNTDNRLVSGTTLVDELDHVARAHHLNFAQVQALCENAFLTAFLSQERRNGYLQVMRAAVTQYLSEHDYESE